MIVQSYEPNKISEVSMPLRWLNELIRQLEHFIKNPTLDDKILHKLIERIETKEDKSPRIFYRFSNSYIASIFLEQHTALNV